MKALFTVCLLAAALAGCSTEPGRRLQGLFETARGKDVLATGLRQYEDGAYAESAKSLQSAIDLGLTDKQRLNAHKHLAFIHCASGRERNCREEFRKALAIDPSLELAPAEAGHPAWGPVFRSLKAGK